jgi:aspartate/methionine/tyrosine aminotransferase
MFEPVQHAAIRALGLCESNWFDNSNNIYMKRRAVAFRFLNPLGCAFDQSSSGMFVWARVPALYSSGEQLSEILLNKSSVFVAPGHIFGSNGINYIRISLCSPLKRLEEAEARIQRLITESK